MKDRKAFGGTIWDFQNTRFKLADIKANAGGVAQRWWTTNTGACAGALFFAGEEAAIAKLYSTEALWGAVDDMVGPHGGEAATCSTA